MKVKKIDITKTPETSKEYDVVVCPTLVFPDFIKVCGICDQAILEELALSYYINSFEFQQESVGSIPT